MDFRFPFPSITTAGLLLLSAFTNACIDRPDPSNPVASHTTTITLAPELRGVLEMSDRPATDRTLDATYHPDEVLSFLGAHPRMGIGELTANTGYHTEVISRVLGPEGHLFAQNPRPLLERYAAAPWTQRLSRRVLGNVIRLDRDLNAPFPPDLRTLDAVYSLFSMHVIAGLNANRREIHASVFRSLRPGGVYGIAGFSARAGRGFQDAGTLGRIEEAALIAEVREAGFRLESVGDFLRNPQDTRDWNARTANGELTAQTRPLDRFVLKFVKP